MEAVTIQEFRQYAHYLQPRVKHIMMEVSSETFWEARHSVWGEDTFRSASELSRALVSGPYQKGLQVLDINAKLLIDVKQLDGACAGFNMAGREMSNAGRWVTAGWTGSPLVAAAVT